MKEHIETPNYKKNSKKIDFYREILPLRMKYSILLFINIITSINVA